MLYRYIRGNILLQDLRQSGHQTCKDGRGGQDGEDSDREGSLLKSSNKPGISRKGDNYIIAVFNFSLKCDIPIIVDKNTGEGLRGAFF